MCTRNMNFSIHPDTIVFSSTMNCHMQIDQLSDDVMNCYSSFHLNVPRLLRLKGVVPNITLAISSGEFPDCCVQLHHHLNN
jgi:hypothetical protein